MRAGALKPPPVVPAQIFDACEAFSLKLYGQVMSPPLTFVVARKRHGTRMYPMPQDRQSADSGGNLFPGERCKQMSVRLAMLLFVDLPAQTPRYVTPHA